MMLLNGVLGGLVSITTACNIVGLHEEIIISTIGEILVPSVDFHLLKFKIDDVVGAIPVHLAEGIWGTIAVALFGNLDCYQSLFSTFSSTC